MSANDVAIESANDLKDKALDGTKKPSWSDFMSVFNTIVENSTIFNDYDEHLKKMKEGGNKKAVRDFVDFTDYTTEMSYTEEGVDDKRIIVEKGSGKALLVDESSEILRMFDAYQIKSCKIDEDVLEVLLDINPELFDGVDIDIIETEDEN